MGDRVEFSVGAERREDCFVVHVHGELDMANAAAFGAAVSSGAGSAHVVLDLSACTFLDSAGMRVITAAMRDVPRVSIVATDPGIKRVLHITTVDTMVSVHPSLDAVL